MTFHVKGSKHRHKVHFPKRTTMNVSSTSSQGTSASARLEELLSRPVSSGDQNDDDYVEEIGRSFEPRVTMSAKTAAASMIPEMFTTLPVIQDLLRTETSEDQIDTAQEVLPFLSGLEDGLEYNVHGVPHLDRRRHMKFLHKSVQNLPAPYVAADASRPWLMYWALAALSTLGEDVSSYRERVAATARTMQNPTGGFGGGNGQMSHLAPSYAVMLSLATVGGEEALSLIDRRAMWEWLGALKQPDGGFQMSVGGEEDVR
jgi:protein farnesyltransferase subunit beta